MNMTLSAMRAFGRDTAFLTELFQAITRRSRGLLRLESGHTQPAAELAAKLMSSEGEASGVRLAASLLARWGRLEAPGRLAWLKARAEELGRARPRLDPAVEAWRADPTPVTAHELHRASEPLRQELFRRINLA